MIKSLKYIVHQLAKAFRSLVRDSERNDGVVVPKSRHYISELMRSLKIEDVPEPRCKCHEARRRPA